MVYINPGSVDRPSASSSKLGEDVKTTKVGHLPQKARNLPASCLEIIQQSCQNKGFSQEASERMAKAQKDSTLAVYQGKWNVFVVWCKDNNIDPGYATAPQVADFLCSLRRDKNLATSTLEGYRTAISRVVKAVSGVDLGKDQDLSSLLSNFARSAALDKSLVPKWDLSLVLLTLTKSPFEPMHIANLKFVTLKTIFLLALASGRRRGELHALQANVMHARDWADITIFTDMTFVAKTQLRGH